MKKRLLKDLPFGDLKKDTVLHKVNGGYQENRGNTYYEEGGSSSNGIYVCEKNEQEIIDLIWENPEWFQEAIINHVDFVPTTTGITMRFESMDIEDVEWLTKGVMHILGHLEDDNYIWNKFTGFSMSIKNR